MAKLSDDELLTIVDTEFENALGAEGGEISSERALAWKFYLSEPLGNEIDGESSVVTSDVSDVVDGIMPSLLRIFTTADNLVSFDPVSQEDIPKAEQESDYVDYVFFKQNAAFLILYSWFFDALVQKNGIVKAWWDDSEVITTESYRNLDESTLAGFMADEELEPIERDERQIPGIDPGTGLPSMVTVHDIKFRRVSKRGRVKVENVPPEEYRISSDSRSLDPSGARMVGQERLAKRSELLAMGFDAAIIDALPANSEILDSPEGRARRNLSEESLDSGGNDRSQDEILVREGYFRIDADGDGKAELRQLFKAGDQLLINEDADTQPFHVISPQPLPHKHFGRATSEKVMDIQEINTTLLRQTLMNLYHSNNPGHAVWEQGIGENTLDDLLTRKIGSTTRFARPPSESYAPMAVPFMAKDSFAMLDYFDKAKRSRTGIADDSEGLQPESLKHIQQTVLASSVDQSRMKIEAIARIFAETGIKSLFLGIHELTLKHQDKVQIVRLRNTFIPVDPRSWKTRFDMTVNIGLGIGTREQNLLHLEAISQKQLQYSQLPAGQLLLTPQNLYQSAAEFVKNANLKMPGMFFTDPGNQKAPPVPDEARQLQMMQAQIAQRQQQLDAQELELDKAKLQLEQREQQLAHQREMAELQRKIAADNDEYRVNTEKLKNELTEMRLKYSGQSTTTQ